MQADRIEREIQGWGEGEECWGISYDRFFGNPHLPELWERVEEDLCQTFDHPSGAKIKINCALIDSGGQANSYAFSIPVYRFVKPRQGRYIFACKGSSESGAPLLAGRLQKNGIRLQHIGTDLAKATIYERLRILTPGPRYMHFPVGRGYDEEFFKQLTAEQCQITKHRGFQKQVWVKKRQRNEALDLRAYSLAAFEIRNPHLAMIGINLRKSAVTTKPTAQAQPLPGKPAVTQAPQQRPFERRRWSI